MTSSSTTVDRNKIPRAAALAVGYSVAANLIARQLLGQVIEFPAGFLPLTPGPIAVFTLIGTAMGGLVFWLMARVLPNPLRPFQAVALAALVLSIIPNLVLMGNPQMAPMPGGTPQAFGVLIVFHVIAGLITIFVLSRMTRG
ncbi:MAG TPA: hypothetical protein DCE76_11335 [Anaerolineaceae bacterium]|jgi:hypothetical protein|nr:hypothetical protein [Anaerolineaceae bacterium]